MGRVQTSVMIDEDKRALAKQRGIKLQDLLDEALNTALELEIPGKAQLEIDKENILKEIELKEKQKNEYLAKYEKELEKLEKDKDEYLTMHQQAIDQLHIKLRFSEKALAEANEEQNELTKLNEYKQLLERAVKNGAWDGDLDEELTQFCIKYRIADFNDAFDEAKEDLINVFYNHVTMDEITKTPGRSIE